MKLATITLLLSTLAASSAVGQVSLDSASVSLSSTGTTTISSVGGGSGTLLSVGCIITAGLDGPYSAVLKVYLVGGASYASYTLFSDADTLASPLLVYRTQAYLPTEGSVGDTFVLPLNLAYTSGLTVEVTVTAAGTDGSLTCSDLHT